MEEILLVNHGSFRSAFSSVYLNLYKNYQINVSSGR